MADPSYDPHRSPQYLTDPSAAAFVATQLNSTQHNSNRAQGAPSIKDLSASIVDIEYRTVAQGAGTLTVTIVDPWLGLITRYGNQPAFIDIDDAGLLIPVDVNFPQGTDSWWRICAADISIQTNQANVILTFEDRIVTLLRDLGGAKRASNNQTRPQFIASLVKHVPGLKFVCPALSHPPGSVGGDLTQGQINSGSVPASAKQPNAPAGRKNPTKAAGIGANQNRAIALSPRQELSLSNPPAEIVKFLGGF